MTRYAFAENLADNFDQGKDVMEIPSLANIWAKKYIQNLQPNHTEEVESVTLSEVLSSHRRNQTAEKLLQALRFSSAQAWAKTESLLMGQMESHRISADLIDPWQIAIDSRSLLEQALEVYTSNSDNRLFALDIIEDGETFSLSSYTQLPTTGQLSVAIAKNVGAIRQKYTEIDPRVLGFVSMQFHFSGQILLDSLPSIEKQIVNSYLKVIDDHLYMPLQRCYDAAGELSYNNKRLEAVRQLLSMISAIAHQISEKVVAMYPDYHSHSGLLSSPQVRISSLRDIEMFQVYLCLSALEQSVVAFQEELFPLCIMLYPALKVNWTLVRTLLQLLSEALHKNLDERYALAFAPYLKALSQMFGEDVLP